MNDFLKPVIDDPRTEPLPYEDDMGPVGGADIEEVYPVKASGWDDEDEMDRIPSSVPSDDLEAEDEEEDDDSSEDTGEDLTGDYDEVLVD